MLSDVPPVQHQNFEESQEAMKQQLLQLSVLLKALDPELCDFLGELVADVGGAEASAQTLTFALVSVRLAGQRLALLLLPLAAHLVQEGVFL